MKPYFDTLYDVSGLGLIIVAIFALLIAVLQSRESARNRRAAVIMEIEARWSTPELLKSRERFTRLSTQFYRVFEKKHSSLSNGSSAWQQLYADELKTYINEKLTELRSLDATAYQEFLAQAEFFEYIGFLVVRRYLGAFDVYSLLGPSCINFYDLLSQHVSDIRDSDRSLEASRNSSYRQWAAAFQNFETLVGRLRNFVPD